MNISLSQLSNGVSTDTRTLMPGQLFVALVGPNFDGHNFIKEAEQKGAAGIVVSRPVETSLPSFLVADTRIALGELAKQWRQQFSIPIVALTGTAGKTTTKTLLGAILSQCGELLITPGTLNNDIGVPLTLLQLNSEHQYAVIEMGTNHVGEIEYLAQMVEPTVAMVLNAGPGHLEFLGTIEGVAHEKGSIYDGLTDSGVAIINADDDYAGYWSERAYEHRRVMFGRNGSPHPSDTETDHPVDVWASDVTLNKEGCAHFVLHVETQQIHVQLQVPGEHNVMNALAAASAAWVLGISLTAIKTGLEAALPVTKRLVARTGIRGVRIMDDTYNANPSSFKAAIDILTQLPGKEKILIMGDMRELGPMSADFHKEIGELAKQKGIHRLYAVGTFSTHAVQAFGEGAAHFPDQISLIEAVKPTLNTQMTILVKGSRGMAMEHVVAGLMDGNQ